MLKLTLLLVDALDAEILVAILFLIGGSCHEAVIVGEVVRVRHGVGILLPAGGGLEKVDPIG